MQSLPLCTTNLEVKQVGAERVFMDPYIDLESWTHVPSGRYGIVSAERHVDEIVGAGLESHTFLR